MSSLCSSSYTPRIDTGGVRQAQSRAVEAGFSHDRTGFIVIVRRCGRKAPAYPIWYQRSSQPGVGHEQVERCRTMCHQHDPIQQSQQQHEAGMGCFRNLAPCHGAPVPPQTASHGSHGPQTSRTATLRVAIPACRRQARTRIYDYRRITAQRPIARASHPGAAPVAHMLPCTNRS